MCDESSASWAQALLKQVRFREGGNQGDTLVLVGDLVNKGPHSAAVVATVRQLGALCVRGNHDDSALEAYRQHAAGKKVKVERFPRLPGIYV